MKVVMRVAFILCLWAVGAVGQEKDLSPIMTAELAEDSVAVGQPLVLRVTVLVPTWMPKPPVFPSFDAPNMILRLPERASTPISKRINGDTWAGISRSYRLYPMIPGVFNLSPNALEITYADPETLKPIEASLPLPAISFTATVPSGAEDLDPLIVAEDVTLTQTFEGPDKVLSEGEAVVRRVTAQIAGSSPLFLPDMIGVFELSLIHI